MGIKEILSGIVIKKELELRKKRRRAPVAFTDAVLMGILYNADDEKQRQMAKELVDVFKENKKEAVTLGYMDVREFPHNVRDRYGFEYFNKKFTNWMGIPNHANVITFSNQDFDFLINLDTNHPQHFLYLLSRSKAGCRVGPYSEAHSQYYDFMIEAAPNEFGEAVVRYLQKLG